MAVEFPSWQVRGTASLVEAEEKDEPFELIVTAWNETQAMLTVLSDLERASFTEIRIQSVSEVRP